MTEKVKEFLTDPYNLDLIQNNQWDKVYNKELNNYNFYPKDKGDLTITLLSCGINPLDYFTYKIPDDYLCRIDPGVKMIEEITIPEGIEEIGSSAFCQNESLLKVNFPKSLYYIDRAAFYECVNLSEINYNGTIAEWKRIGQEDKNTTFYSVKAKYIKCLDGNFKIRTDKGY